MSSVLISVRVTRRDIAHETIEEVCSWKAALKFASYMLVCVGYMN